MQNDILHNESGRSAAEVWLANSRITRGLPIVHCYLSCDEKHQRFLQKSVCETVYSIRLHNKYINI